ncbi:hypothetical protein [Cupriavidus gilardii]|uniref:hypothetical protein n=1 Tax=Cupriavidus gilardii TaxID=82541 RepID=UPI0012E73E58|nr:hypothetical protein [Cupriavidus gilardii]
MLVEQKQLDCAILARRNGARRSERMMIGMIAAMPRESAELNGIAQAGAQTVKSQVRKIWRRAAIACMALSGLPGVILIFSFARGSGWTPVLVGLPVICTIFVSVTYQLIRELRAAVKDTEMGQGGAEVSKSSQRNGRFPRGEQ